VDVDEVIRELGLSIEAKFVPFSLSWNAVSAPKSEDLQLNWSVTLKRNGKLILTTDYSQGIGHIPGYKPGQRMTVYLFERLQRVCEDGRPLEKGLAAPSVKLSDVIYSLVSDGNAIDYPTYEEYARDLGMEEDSRAGEKIYRACLEIGLKLRQAIGEDGLAKLREAFQNY
jgi:hypothetical protein